MTPEELQTRGLLELLDVELARALSRAGGGEQPEVELAVALTSRSVRRGHTCFRLDLDAAQLWPQGAALPDKLPEATRWREALRESRLTRGGPLVLDDAGRLYLRRYWQLERDIAAQLVARAAAPPTSRRDFAGLEASLDRLFPGSADSPQRRAAKKTLEHRVSLLCGGPGTGKTTTVAAIVALLVERRLHDTSTAPEVMLLAPTGKSAARLGEAVSDAKTRIQASQDVLDKIPERATTIHRALGLRRAGMRFARSADFPLDADVVVVDEASMIDLALMRQLLEATPPDATLLIVGDPEQLASVEAGSVLRDLVTASAKTWWNDRVTELTKTYRYDERQPLGRLVAAIRQGNTAEVDALLNGDQGGDVAWAPLEHLSCELDRAAGYWSSALGTRDPEHHFELRSRYVMLSPFRAGPIGARQLGKAIVERLRDRVLAEPSVTPIIIEQNSQELGVFNGDFAMLIQDEPPLAIVQRDAGDHLTLTQARLPRYADAFALSVHKAQGSEFEELLVLLPEEDAPLLTRELLYTAVSRARKRVRVIGPKEVIRAALERRAERYSGLVDAIAQAEHLPSDR